MKVSVRNIYRILTCISVCFIISSCSDDEPEYNPSDDKVVNTILSKACTEWNSSKEQIQKHMKGYSLVDSDENFLQYSDKNGAITVSYDFINDSLRATAAIVPKLSDSDITPYLDDYVDFAELSSKKIYYNSQQNTMCFSYETEVQDVEYTVIGFTPIISNLYASVQPIIVTTIEASDISRTSCRIYGSVSGIGKSCTCGVRYSTNADLSPYSTKTSTSRGDFSLRVSGLSRNTTYYCQCYV